MSINATSSVQQTAALQGIRRPPPGYFDDSTKATPSSPTITATTQGAGGTDPFTKLATDLQAALVALQSNQTGTTSSSSTDALTTLKNDLTALTGESQSTTGSPSQTATPTAHHHHHHQADATTASAATTDATTARSGATQAASGKSLFADLIQAFQAYTPPSTTTAKTLQTAA